VEVGLLGEIRERVKSNSKLAKLHKRLENPKCRVSKKVAINILTAFIPAFPED
jgi:hypothetical protein